MTANKPMTGAQLDELMAVAMRMQSDSEKMGERSVSMFAYAVQVAVLEIRETRCKYEELQSQNADLAVQLANADSKCRELQRDNDSLEAVAVSMRDDMRDARENLEELDNALCELLTGTQYMDPPDGGSVTPLEQVRRMVDDYRGRIEELESRAVCLPKLPVLGSNSEWYEGFAAGTSGMRNECADAIRAAGIGVKGECKGGACE